MEGFELSIMINRPIEEVFGFLANLENDLEWRREWVDAKNTSGGSLGVGATFRLSSEFLGRQIPTVYEVIEYEPNRRAAWKAVSGPLPLTFQRTFERVEGGTRFTDMRRKCAASSSWLCHSSLDRSSDNMKAICAR